MATIIGIVFLCMLIFLLCWAFPGLAEIVESILDIANWFD